ncbi:MULTISPECIES: helix-turn-helix domain-containing protein [Streptomyces]|uniref:DNA-binding protein n=2 Tax=Streptomyces TaxID=1883 RepID=A0A3S9PK52_STRLT|nr:helix-turn-helix domain-containing protein [Streptomyces luteoverticillatus]AZQ72721.1 DNA-binding protein [Streptomyces luteoverticillatus]
MTTTHLELLTVPEAMALLRLGRSKIYDLIRTRRLPSIKVDGARRIPADAVRTFILDRLKEAA